LAGGGWRQWQAPPQDAAATWETIDLSGVPAGGRPAVLEREAERLQRSLDLQNGPSLRAGWFHWPGERRLLLIIHHLAVDGLSWRILLEDLLQAAVDLRENREPRLPRQTSSFAAWSDALSRLASSAEWPAELAWWERISAAPAGSMRRDPGPAENLLESERIVSMDLDPAETRLLLQEVPRAYRTQIQEVLLTAVARALVSRSGQRCVRLDLEGHGREELPGVDVSRTVGWFTTLYPFSIELSGVSLEDDLKHVKEMLRRVPRHGLGYGILRRLHPVGRDRLRSMPPSDICFNYLGQFDQVLSGGWKIAPERAGTQRSPSGRRPYVLDIVGQVGGGRLRLEWRYSCYLHAESGVRTLAEACMGELRQLIAQSQTADGACAPSDFPLATLTQEELDQIRSLRARQRNKSDRAVS
jgi:non-ribosomal peptide synthase protein (TIGR01720 family)